MRTSSTEKKKMVWEILRILKLYINYPCLRIKNINIKWDKYNDL